MMRLRHLRIALPLIMLANVVGRFIEDAQHRIWIATDDAGLECYNPAADAALFTSNPFMDYPGRSVLAQYNVHGLLAEGNYLWVGTYGNGIIKMDMSTGNMKTYQTDAHVTGSNSYCLYRDSQHRLWASSLERVNLWNEQEQVFKPLGPIKACAIDIEEDKQGNVWFATQGSGLWCYRKNHTWKQYLNVAFLASQLGMSRSSLFNKIRGLADVTPNEMIQLVKLKRGARLLKEGQYRISEVSYMCGFSSPSYFAKCFQKQFGVKPMDFAEQ